MTYELRELHFFKHEDDRDLYRRNNNYYIYKVELIDMWPALIFFMLMLEESFFILLVLL